MPQPAAGVRTFSLTDHDTLAGYRDVVAAGAVPPGMTLIPGVEINALVTRDLGLWEGELHILGFGMDPDDEAFEAALAAQRGRRRERFERTVILLRDLGLPIDAQVAALAVGDDDALGRPTIARALIAAGFAESVEDAFSRIIGHGAPGYVRREGLGPEEAIAVIRAADGIPVLAHFREAPTRADVLTRARRGRTRRSRGLLPLVRQRDRGRRRGGRRRVSASCATGGSDYHGDLGSYAETHARLWVPPEVGLGLLERLDGDPVVGREWPGASARPRPEPVSARVGPSQPQPVPSGSASSFTNVGRSSTGVSCLRLRRARRLSASTKTEKPIAA